MKMTPDQRRRRIFNIAEADEEYQQIMRELTSARNGFDQAVKWMPGNVRNQLGCFPGLGYFLFHRMLTIVCAHMIFPDEE